MFGEIMGDCGWFVVDCGQFWRNKGAGENREKKNGAGEDRERKRGRERRKMGMGGI